MGNLYRSTLLQVFLLTCLLLAISGCASQPQQFSVQIRVQDATTSQNIVRAIVILNVSSEAPLDELTDNQGTAIIPVNNEFANKLAILEVQAVGYQTLTKNITIKKGALPEVIVLTPQAVNANPKVTGVPTKAAETTASQETGVPTTVPATAIPQGNTSTNPLSTPIRNITPRASSSYVSWTAPDAMFDGNLNTNWAANEEPVGTWLTLLFDKEYTVTRIGINAVGGGRIKTAVIKFSDNSEQRITLRGINGWEYVDINPVKANEFTITVAEIHEGTSGNIAIIEMQIYGYE